MKFRPLRRRFASRALSVMTATALCLTGFPLPAQAQDDGISLLRDAETEALLHSYEDPILTVAGLSSPSVHIYIVNDPSINAFVAEGQNIFINSGLIMELDTPNQIMGVIAHETGHMADGHLVRGEDAIRAASIPMLIGMAAGIAAMATGNGNMGMAAIAAGQQVAERQFLAFSRTQEASADQAGQRFLRAIGVSGQGMVDVFKRFENDEVLTGQKIDPFAQSHPVSGDRIAHLEDLVAASPYKDKKDTPEAQHAYDMVRAKMRGYLERPDITLRRYPPSDTSKPARYARAMAYLHLPDMGKAVAEASSLLAEEPDNPYFLEMLGQINVEMGKVKEGIEPYRKAVRLKPDAPLIRISLAAAMLGTEDPVMTQTAGQELEKALRDENDNSFAWYELAQAYGRMGLVGKADLATAERFFVVGAYPQAQQFAGRAQKGLAAGSIDWQRANDILAISQSQRKDQSRR